LEAFGEDMLEQAADELLAGDRVGVWEAGVVAVAEGDTVGIPAIELAFVEGWFAKIVGQIF
jgi:hypothetical protein